MKPSVIKIALSMFATIAFSHQSLARNEDKIQTAKEQIVRLSYVDSLKIEIKDPAVVNQFESFENDCKARLGKTSPKYDSCTLSSLFKLYNLRKSQVEQMFESEYLAQSNWTFSDLIAGAFNLRLTMNASQKSVKPIVDLIVVHYAINSELKNYKKFLDGLLYNAHFAKRNQYPRLMSYFGGLTPLAKMQAFASALSCDFKSIKDGSVAIENECYALQANLTTNLRRLSANSLPDTNRIVAAINEAANQPEHTPSASVANALANTQLLLGKIAKLAPKEILDWASNSESCSKQKTKQQSTLVQLCKRLNLSLDQPEDISNPMLVQTIVSAVGLYEISVALTNAAKFKASNKKTRAMITQFPKAEQFIEDAEQDISNSMIQIYSSIVEHHLQYDPSSIIEPGFEQRTLWEN
jgi:hypothetical protein